jgi:transcriptional regulator with XRE-family HTH domain
MSDETELLVHVGKSIRARRKRAKLTISQLAELAGIDPGFLAYIETGKKMPSLATAAKLASALRIPLSELFRGAPQKTDTDYQVQRQIESLLQGRTAAEKADLLALLKQLRDPSRVRALRQVIRR